MSKEDKELAEMEEMLKQLEPVIPSPEVDLRDEILLKSKEHWKKKRVIPIGFLAACAALLVIAGGLRYISTQGESQSENSISVEDGKDKDKEELKKNLDKTLKGER
jgi:hypothetical protein